MKAIHGDNLHEDSWQILASKSVVSAQVMAMTVAKRYAQICPARQWRVKVRRCQSASCRDFIFNTRALVGTRWDTGMNIIYIGPKLTGTSLYIYYLIHSDNDMIRYMYIYICYINIGINKYACLGVVKGATAPRSSNYIWFSPTKGHVTGVCHGCRRLVVSQRAKDHAWWAASRASCTADDLATDRRIATDTTDRGTFHLWLCWRSADRWVGDVCESMHQTKQEQARG